MLYRLTASHRANDIFATVELLNAVTQNTLSVQLERYAEEVSNLCYSLPCSRPSEGVMK